MEAAWDMVSMHHTSSKVMVLETMGRNSGWLAAATTIVSHRYALPHILCVPEHVHDPTYLLERIHDDTVRHGFALLTLAEGYPFSSKDHNYVDPFGHAQEDGQGKSMAEWISNTLHVKTRYIKPDCLQRSAGHLISQYDWELSHSLAIATLEAIESGLSGVMIATSNADITSTCFIDAALVANQSRHLHPDYLTSSGIHTTPLFVDYIEPLIEGEVYPRYDKGLPAYTPPIVPVSLDTISHAPILSHLYHEESK